MPDRRTIAGARLNIEGSLRRPQSGQTHACLPRPLADHGVGLRPSTEDPAEELSGTPVQRIAPIGKTPNSHLCAPCGNPPGPPRPEHFTEAWSLPQTHGPLFAKIINHHARGLHRLTGCLENENRSAGRAV